MNTRPDTLTTDDRPSQGLTRRGLLGAAGLGLASGGYALGAAAGQADPTQEPEAVPFYGRHQSGIATAPPEHVTFATFDLDTVDADALRSLLQEWTATAARLTGGKGATASQLDGTADPGEARGLPAARLTLTVGLGASIFDQDGEDRMGLAALRPSALDPLPYFRGDSLDPARSDGDLCVQACADNAQVVFHAVHALVLSARGVASLRWTQSGFRGAKTSGERDPRNLMGFKDGTANVDPTDDDAMRRSVWVSGREEPSWMTNGSYLVARRIRILLDSWDALSLDGQERAVGRRKGTGAPLAQLVNGRPDLKAAVENQAVIPSDAHIRLAAPDQGDGPPLLRRSYSFSDGASGDGRLDAGLLFLAYQRDPQRQFVPVQQRLASQDALGSHLQHTASGLFACPPGVRPGGYLAQALFERL
jgi:deferrochelatase/peroxidase EfeB